MGFAFGVFSFPRHAEDRRSANEGIAQSRFLPGNHNDDATFFLSIENVFFLDFWVSGSDTFANYRPTLRHHHRVLCDPARTDTRLF